MTVRTHIACILRQGIWASLTGGWCYDRTSSLLANTVHLYLWLLLFTAPLLLALARPRTWTVPTAVYAIVIGCVFAVIKATVWQLHRLFDTKEPSILVRPITNNKTRHVDGHHNDISLTTEQLRTNDESGVGRARGAGDDLEMTVMRSADTVTTARFDSVPPVAYCYDAVQHDDQTPVTNLAVQADVHMPGMQGGETSMKMSYQLLPVDSLELLPITSGEQTAAHQSVDVRSPTSVLRYSWRRSGMRRKMSEPLVATRNGELQPPRRHSQAIDSSALATTINSAAQPRSVRRVRSSVDTEMHAPAATDANSKSMSAMRLSAHTLDECRHRGYKSYPSKTSSTDIFLTGCTRLPASTHFESLSNDSMHGDTMIIEVPEHEPPSHAESIEQTRPTNDFIDDLREQLDSCLKMEPASTRGSTPRSIAWLFDGPSSAPPGSPISHTSTVDSRQVNEALVAKMLALSHGADGDAPRQLDLKNELTRLLQEILAKHPDAIEAIESAIERSGIGAGRSTTQLQQPAQQAPSLPIDIVVENDRPGPSRVLPSVSTDSRAPATPSTSAQHDSGSKHLAMTHDDTSEGAVHCFEDADGNIYSYTFGTNGQNTARIIDTHTMPTVAVAQTTQHKVPLLYGGVDTEAGMSSVRYRGRRSVPHDDSSSGVGSSDEDENNLFQRPAHVLGPAVADRSAASGGLRAMLRASADSGSQTAWNDFLRQIRHDSHRATIVQQRLSTDPPARGVTSIDVPTPTQPANPADRAWHRRELSTAFETLMSSQENQDQSMRFLDLLGQRAKMTSPSNNAPLKPPKRLYYPIDLMPKWLMKIFCMSTAPPPYKLRIDRLNVMAVFDRNRYRWSCALDTLLAVAVAVMACAMIMRAYFVDIQLILFCIVVAGAQFSLLKSVQPDAASPIHGFNTIVTYSRAAYFLLICSLILLADVALAGHNVDDTTGYALGLSNVTWPVFVHHFRQLLICILLALPAIFTFGLLPQMNTFMQHVCEQLDMHVFGGTATFSMLSALFAIIRSVLCVGLLTLFITFGLKWTPVVPTAHVVFSAFIACTVGISYALSRMSSSARLLWTVLRGGFEHTTDACRPHDTNNNANTPTTIDDVTGMDAAGEPVDPLPGRLKATMLDRLKHDSVCTVLFTLVTFGVHTSSVFVTLQPTITWVFVTMAVVLGALNHYLWPQLRKQTPWMCIAQPILRTAEHGKFETTSAAQLCWFERVYVYTTFIERNLVHPLLVISIGTLFATAHTSGTPPYLLALMCTKLLRHAFCNAAQLYIPLAIAALYNMHDLHIPSQLPDLLPTYYLAVIAWCKLVEMYTKLQFISAYTAPWQLSWGSSFHAFAQPFSGPHVALTLAQVTISSLFSAPMNPFLGSSFFITSYMRPVKFWEKDYNTRRVDHSNTRLVNQLHRGPTTDDSNFNAIFYEHLTSCLQQSLAGDLALGRWCTTVSPGDCFILASFYLNCMVHIIECGNGFVTFQLRGLEFRGTYCQQREVEAISEDIGSGDSQDGCCCCEPGHLPGLLSLNTAWSLRWLAWHCTTTKYVTEGYSITENSAVNMLQLHELRSLLVDFYVKCIIYYTIQSNKLREWLHNDAIVNTLQPIIDWSTGATNTAYVDGDRVFSAIIDRDYDHRLKGISTTSFANTYGAWVRYCVEQKVTSSDDADGDFFVEQDMSAPSTSHASTTTGDTPAIAPRLQTLCYVLSLVGRRALGAAAQYQSGTASFASAENFLYGIHSLFKGDFRDTSVKDEWMYADIDLLRTVIAPAVRMALKLHQEHFAVHDELLDGHNLYSVIQSYESYLFISHEHDPAWRTAVLADTPALLALRHVVDDGTDDFKVIMLTRRFLNFRVVKLNAECVRAFWAGQQQELIYLRNRNPERGSIQNAKPVLRNMINSSADQPIGYPIYVSPLTTSFVETHADYVRLVGAACTPTLLTTSVTRVWRALRNNFGTSGSHLQAATMPTTVQLPVIVEMQPIPVDTSVPAMPQCATATSQTGSVAATVTKCAGVSSSNTVITTRSLPIAYVSNSGRAHRRRYSIDAARTPPPSATMQSTRRVESMITLKRDGSNTVVEVVRVPSITLLADRQSTTKPVKSV